MSKIKNSRRSVLRGLALGATAPLLPALADTASAAPRPLSAGDASFRWLGTSGWRIDAAGQTLLVDPYVTRFATGIFAPPFNSKTVLPATNATRADELCGTPDWILVTHSHWDHIADVPYLAEKHLNARVIGTETTRHLLVAWGVDPDRIIVVRGGETLDLGGGLIAEIAASLHSRNKTWSYFAPGTLTAPPAAAPENISDLPEGNTLAFLVKAGSDGPSVFLMGASDIDERAVAGMRPQIAMVATESTFHRAHRYVPRLLEAIGRPEVVVPVHWDNFETDLGPEVVPDTTMDLTGLIDQVRRLSPGTRIVLPDYRTVYGGDMRPR
ncbi:hypothetical protein SRB5_36120 [Streptomyces sp. RB5]|uniref:Metallo-beta-lactamase domain-containing protein n=1 Tax=Streptomyces smaragdinus TaxID=2585196 RepID=A0A7K0CL30_9ACTN|nr:MBL fold metallo-hydrolase [Streptomyces smaragdinus]MQY13464.1 hypothetical protein [Streptomyces smaragdinus]